MLRLYQLCLLIAGSLLAPVLTSAFVVPRTAKNSAPTGSVAPRQPSQQSSSTEIWFQHPHPRQQQQQQQQQYFGSSRSNNFSRSSPSALAMADETKGDNKAPFWLDPNTKGGALVLMVVLFAVPYLGYQFLVNALGYDEIDAGIGVGMGFTVLSTLAWMSTYLFRVATKDMTYVSYYLLE